MNPEAVAVCFWCERSRAECELTTKEDLEADNNEPSTIVQDAAGALSSVVAAVDTMENASNAIW
jgi:isoaspartyl peptidase/L-asparaginase-like protein (Ntn-hydrolase superfamily)